MTGFDNIDINTKKVVQARGSFLINVRFNLFYR